jgi:hypothetical protein
MSTQGTTTGTITYNPETQVIDGWQVELGIDSDAVAYMTVNGVIVKSRSLRASQRGALARSIQAALTAQNATR